MHDRGRFVFDGGRLWCLGDVELCWILLDVAKKPMNLWVDSMSGAYSNS